MPQENRRPKCGLRRGERRQKETNLSGQKQYSTSEFVGGAMQAFWARGYEGTSMNDLVTATGVNRGSIYSDFNGKRDIFLAALKQYDEVYRARFLSALSSRYPPKEAIVAAFAAAADVDAARDGPRGCLLVNTAIELAPHDNEIANLVTDSLRAVEEFFLQQLEAYDGTVVGHGSPQVAAKTLLGLFLGLRVLTRSGAEASTRKAIVEQVERILA